MSVAILVWRITIWNNRGWTGMEIRQTGKVWEITDVLAGGPAYSAGIPTGVYLRSINAIPLDSVQALEQFAKKIHVGDSLAYRIKAEHNETDYVLRVNSPLNVPHILFSLVVGIVVALIFLLLGFVVYIKKADDKRTIVFSLMAISAAAYFILDAVTLIDAKNALGIFSESGVTLGGAAIESFVLIVEFLPILFLLHLALIFPRERPMIRIRPEIVRWMYWFPLPLIPTPKIGRAHV